MGPEFPDQSRTPANRPLRPVPLAWAGLANSYYWIDPVKHVAGVYATQLLPFYDAQAVSLFGAFESVV